LRPLVLPRNGAMQYFGAVSSVQVWFIVRNQGVDSPSPRGASAGWVGLMLRDRVQDWRLQPAQPEAKEFVL
jgi:hypothetical protein